MPFMNSMQVQQLFIVYIQPQIGGTQKQMRQLLAKVHGAANRPVSYLRVLSLSSRDIIFVLLIISFNSPSSPLALRISIIWFKPSLVSSIFSVLFFKIVAPFLF